MGRKALIIVLRDISIELGAKKLGISVEEFLEKYQRTDYKETTD